MQDGLVLLMMAVTIGTAIMFTRFNTISNEEAAAAAVASFKAQMQLDVDDMVHESMSRPQVFNIMNPPTGKTYPDVKYLPPRNRKRILVTGGAGFIGSNLVDVLMQQGHEVTVVDNLFTGRKKNIHHWLGHPNFDFHRRDIVQPIMYEIDQIYHLACPASPPHYMYNPIKTIKTSAQGTLNVLGLAKRVRARMLFTSTSEVYGDPEVHPQSESYWGHVNPIGPRACYDEGKRVAETMCYAYAKESGVEVRVARIFNTFGPRMHPDDGRVVSNFLIQGLKGDDLTVYGDGSQTRSFQYVSDLVRGLISLMNSDLETPCNLGNPEETTIRGFAERIVNMIEDTKPGDTTLSIKHQSANIDDPKKRRPDIGLAKRALDWEPKVSVEQGLLTTIRYFREELNLEERRTTLWLDADSNPVKQPPL